MGDIVHRYSVRFPCSEWSVWLVDERTGTLVVFGDRGTWSYTWGHWGRGDGFARRDFRFELLRFGDDYLLRKLSVGRPLEFDEEGARKEWLAVVLRFRRERRIDDVEAREIFDTVKNLDGERDFWSVLDEQLDSPLGYELRESGQRRVVRECDVEMLMARHWPLVRSQMASRIMGERSLAWFRKVRIL